MDAKLVSAVLREFSNEADHEGWVRREDLKRIVIKVHDTEWESYSGLHTLDTTVLPAYRDIAGWTYYVLEPVVDVMVYRGQIRVDIFQEVPRFTDILKKLDGMPAILSGYRIPNELAPLASRAGLQWFAWWVKGEYHDKHGEPVEVLFVKGPASEREAAQWLAEWLNKRIPEYLAKWL